MSTPGKGLVAAGLALLWAGSAAAGTVVLPLALSRTLQGKTYHSSLWATNLGDAPETVELRFIAADTSGLGGPADASVVVEPGQTRRIVAGDPGTLGMVEATAGDAVVFAGRVESFSTAGLARSQAHVPVVGADDLFAAGTTAHLQGLERSLAGAATHLGVVTAGEEDGVCTIKAFRADGSQLAGTATVVAFADGLRWFEDAFALLGETSLGDARFDVSCDVPFYPFAAVFAGSPDSTQFVIPSLGGDAGVQPPVGTGELLRKNGVFLDAVQGDAYLSLPLPIAAGVRYSELEVEFDVYVPKLTSPTDVTFWGTLVLLRPVKGGTYLAHTIRGNGRNKTTLDMGIGTAGVFRGENDAWQEQASHHVKVVYDADARQATWELRRGGALVERIVATTGTSPLRHDGEGIHVRFGYEKVYDNAYFPPWGFRFSNLVVRGVPVG